MRAEVEARRLQDNGDCSRRRLGSTIVTHAFRNEPPMTDADIEATKLPDGPFDRATRAAHQALVAFVVMFVVSSISPRTFTIFWSCRSSTPPVRTRG